MWIPTSEAEIISALNAGLDETLTLEVKRELPVKAKNTDVAVDVSAMANETGGVIVYGISEDANKRLDAPAPMPNAHVERERIDQIVRSGVYEPPSIDARVVASSASGVGPDPGFVVVVVPPSDRA